MQTLTIENQFTTLEQHPYSFNRLFDITFATFTIILISPILFIIALAIKIKSPKGSIIFTQERLGLDETIFKVYKFRTMVPDAEERLEKLLANDPKIKEDYIKYRKLQNDPRIIPLVGDFLRKTSLDELPQFFNVLKGDMSIVGPRPYIDGEFITHNQKSQRPVILSIKPGITGYWQTIPDRHDTTFDFRVEKDVEYIQKKSFLLDLKIVLQTVGVMALKKGM